MAAAVAALAVLIGLRTWVVDIYYVGSESMQPTIEPGDRLLVDQTADPQDLQRGDLVVFDGRGSFAPVDEDPPLVDAGQRLAAWIGVRPTDHVFVKRVIGLPGDTVACCDADGRVTVDGEPLDEPYLFPGDIPSETEFEVVVPEDRLWLLGDHRSVSVDSRSLLGAPGGGLVRADRVLGTPEAIVWPPDRDLP
ncbi:signal peptidase I [Kocuria palustris]|uniref:signal peptidase I n=1 Tax=Kocuria palustris TaxID=71999 RepID=UPI0028CB723D|nr:signal peptidase I [Kocuria palustris]